MGLSWQQGPLGGTSVGHFLTREPLPQRLLYVEPLRRRMRVKFADEWIADSEDVVLLHEPGHYPVAFFPLADVRPDVLGDEHRTTQHRDLGATGWFSVTVGSRTTTRAAYQHTGLPDYAGDLRDHMAFAWRAMDAFYEEDERIAGHATDMYHRIDIRRSSRHLVVTDGSRTIADTTRAQVLYESGFAPRWYVPREDIDESTLTSIDKETFCPFKGIASYYDIGPAKGAAWYYPEAFSEVGRVSDMVSFEPDKVDVFLDGKQLGLEPGQTVLPHGIDRGLDPDEIRYR